jgi:hypothetical protein
MHTCPECGQLCTCQGDIDDIDFGEVNWCTHCFDQGFDQDEYDDYWNGEPDEYDPEV